jgi:hypothetical protein
MAVVLSPPSRLAVLDTSVLTTDVIAATRRQEPSSLVAAMRHQTYRGFISHRVWAEVPRVLEDRAHEGEAFDLDRANELWWTTYLPLLRTVCTTELPMDVLDKDWSVFAAIVGTVAPHVVVTSRNLTGPMATPTHITLPQPKAERKM